MKKGVLVVCFIISVLSINAQENGLPLIRNYLPKELIYSPQVYSALQDKRGVMYFGITDYGVLEYDGVEWRGIPNSLKSEVYGLASDKNGRIYLSATNDFGCLKPNQEGKIVFESLKYLLGDSISYIGNVWNVHILGDSVFFFTEKCIYVYRISQNKISAIKPEPGSSFYVPFVFNQEYYILHSTKGIFKLAEKNLIPIPNTSFFSKNIFLSVLPFDSSSVLIPTRSSGLFILNLKENKPLRQLILKPNNDFLLNNNIYTSLAIDKNYVLGSMKKGAILIDKNGQIIQSFDESNLLQNNLVLFSEKDYSNNIWLMLSNGISKIESSQDICYWDKTVSLEGIVNDVTRFNGTLYLVTNQQVYLLDSKVEKNSVNKLVAINDIPPGQNWCLSHFIVPNGNGEELLLAGTQSGIFEIKGNRAKQIYEGTLHAFAIYQSLRNPNRIISTDGFSDMISLIWKNGKWEFEGKWAGIKDDIRAIIEDGSGDLWLGTFTNGIIHVKVNENSITQPLEVKYYKMSDGLPSLNGCKPFIFKKRIVFGTEKGLYVYNETSNRFEPFKEHGKLLIDESVGVANFFEAPNGNLYFSSKSLSTGQISFLTPENNGDYLAYSKPFRRLPEMANVSALFVDADGIIWIGGNEGLYRYNPSKDNKRYDLDFSCLIRKVAIGKDSVIYWGNQIDSKGKPPEIDYALNSIRFNFAAPFFDKEEQIKYSYILGGYDDSWSPWTSSPFKEYTKVKEGKYTFKVKAQNIYGKESTTTEYRINISPPWYRTYVAYFFYCLLVLGLYIFSTRFYSRVLIYQKQKLEKAVLERTTEIRIQKDEIQSQAEEMAAQSEELQEQTELLKKINEELEKLSIVARETDNAIIIMNVKGQFLWINDGFFRLHEQSPEEFFAKYNDLFESSTATNIKEIFQECIDSKHSVVYESTAKKTSGKKIYLQTTITPIFNLSGEIDKLVAIDTDITKLKEADFEIIQKSEEITAQKEELEKHRYHLEQIVRERTLELEVAKNKAEESDKLKSAFLANMSHEIRTPMNAIIGFSSMLNNSDILEEERKEFIQLIASSGNTLLQLIEDIIDISKIESGQMTIVQKNCDINELLKSIYSDFNQKKNVFYQKNIDLQLKLGVESLPFAIKTDPLRLQQVITNLLDNALKFTEKGIVEFGYTIQSNSSNPKIRFFVKDTGIGLTLDEQKLIFNRFIKIENQNTKLYRGAGLGLAICKNIVNLLGGEIGVESELSIGSTFFFTIPLKDTTLLPLKNILNQMNSQTYNWNDKTLLVAEDEDNNFRFIEVLLKNTKVKIIRANNGKEAIEKFISNSIDLVLMDIKMPIMDGLEATRSIKKINSEIPIIAQTAYAMQNDQNICVDAGCNDYISKPIIQEKLFSILNKYLA